MDYRTAPFTQCEALEDPAWHQNNGILSTERHMHQSRSARHTESHTGANHVHICMCVYYICECVCVFIYMYIYIYGILHMDPTAWGG